MEQQQFEGIAKTNTTHTIENIDCMNCAFEGIAKTNTTHTGIFAADPRVCLRVLLKQILPTLKLR